MVKNYGEFITELETLYQNIIKRVAPIGQRLSQLLNEGSDNNIIIFTHDILRRLVSNIKVLLNIKINTDSNVAYKLILRASTSDLIECFYLLAIDEEKREKEIWKQNLEYLRTIQLVAYQKKDFYSSMDENHLSDIDLSIITSNYPEYVDPETNDLYSKKKYKKINTSDMFETLISQNICDSRLNQVYTNYRLLSLTEHYSTAGRKFSYNSPLDHHVILEIVKWIALITELICQAITEYLTTGTIIIEKIEK